MTVWEHDACGVGFVCHTKGERSHQVVMWGIEAVKNLTHRGAVGGDGKTGDGAGILLEIPRKFFADYIEENGLSISSLDNLAVGAVFLYEDVRSAVEEYIKKVSFQACGLEGGARG
jgi:glutamate synthase (NADPH/NADH) large chain